LVGLAAVLATAALVVVTLRGIRDQLWMTTFAEYTRRYSEIMDVLPFEARRPGGSFTLNGLQAQERERVLGAMRKYLNLCSEEFYLHAKGRIDRDTWAIWKTGIRDTIRLPCFQGAWTLLRPEYDYFPAFCGFIDSLTKDGPLSGPAETERLSKEDNT
jgi:hypothetical protein